MTDSSLSEVPEYVDVRKAIDQHLRVEATLPVSVLPRFVDYLSDSDGSVEVRLRFSRGESGRRIISGEIDSRVNVVCQRCLDVAQEDVQDQFCLAVVKSEEAAKELPAEIDPWISEDGKIALRELIEEQLILSMPIVSYHPEGQCEVQAGGDRSLTGAEEADNRPDPEDDPDNPFAVLKSLKNRDNK